MCIRYPKNFLCSMLRVKSEFFVFVLFSTTPALACIRAFLGSRFLTREILRQL